MFVSARIYQQALTTLECERAKREVLERHVNQQHALMQFICARINQLEMERALLVRKLTNVEIPVPHMATSAPRAAQGSAASQAVQGLDGAALFEDMGDDAASALGIRWGNDGRVIYDEPKESDDVPTESRQ